MVHIREALGKLELFEGLTDAQLDKVNQLCREEFYETEATIFTQGEEAKKLYIVEDGRVILEMTIRLGSGPGRHGVIDVVTKGQTLGWSAIVEPHMFTMSARCIEKTKVIALDGAGVRRLLEEDSRMGSIIMERIARIVYSRFSRVRDTLSHILSIASHDLKAPLAAVESYHQVMLGGYAGEITEKQKDMLIRSSERIKGLLDLIDNILDISRIDTRELKMEATSLLKLVEGVKATVQPLAEKKGVKLEVKMPEELPPINGAPNRLQQVFTNLLGNAVKFTPEGGGVTFKMSEEDDHILVEIMDTGVGISPEELPRIFDAFYRGIRVDAAGAGLGLSIAKKIVEAHDGNIWVKSPCPETGSGSKFTFTLPKIPVSTQSEEEEVMKL
ncbi:ATP-binding protein [Chloroflexota bacterium]